MKAEKVDEIIFHLRQIGPVNKQMHVTIRSYSEDIIHDLADYLNVTNRQAFVSAVGQAIKAQEDESFLRNLIDYDEFFVNHSRYSTEFLAHLLTAYQQHDWFEEVLAGEERSNIAAMVINTMSIIETAMYNWELPETIDGSTMDSGNLKYFTRTFNGIAIFEMTDPRLVKMVLDHPEYTEQIERFLVERRTLDYDMLSSVFLSDTPAISAGLL